ncbi:unnamed protein product [Nippostrongylus brasiliensis]|uniref:Secreted protein n=1 Tax=Nippostrongylus brasiliensis TaxID=27835 RepID=A0A0N4Y0K5_NIPBR|nr:unnamed protein product [Nippostrongylus brasiliensis]
MGREPSSSGHLLVRTPTKTLAIVAQLFRSCLLLASAGCNGFGPNIELGQRQQKPGQECPHTETVSSCGTETTNWVSFN